MLGTFVGACDGLAVGILDGLAEVGVSVGKLDRLAVEGLLVGALEGVVGMFIGTALNGFDVGAPSEACCIVATIMQFLVFCPACAPFSRRVDHGEWAWC